MISELIKCDPTYRTRALVQTAKFFRRLTDLEVLRQCSSNRGGTFYLRHLGLGEVIPGMIFAEMHFLGFITRELRDVECCGFFTVFTFHSVHIS